MTDDGLTVIFRTQSDIEANVVEALLDSHGVETLRTSGPTPGLFQFRFSPMGETHIAVRDEDAADAVRIIESHREQVGGGIVVTLPQMFDALEARIGSGQKPRYEPARAGDVKHSMADITRIRHDLGYEPTVGFEAGIDATVRWYQDTGLKTLG